MSAPIPTWLCAPRTPNSNAALPISNALSPLGDDRWTRPPWMRWTRSGTRRRKRKFVRPPGQAKRAPEPTSRNRSIRTAADAFQMAAACGYGSLLSQGRHLHVSLLTLYPVRHGVEARHNEVALRLVDPHRHGKAAIVKRLVEHFRIAMEPGDAGAV